MIYVLEETSGMLILPYCSIVSFTTKSVRIIQHCCEKENEVSIPINQILFSIYNTPTNWCVFEQLQGYNPLAFNYNVAIHSNTKSAVQHRAEMKKVGWIQVEEHIQPENFQGTFPLPEDEVPGLPRSERNLHNYYAILGIDPEAPIAIIKEVWEKLVMIYHPDRATGNTQHFRMVSEAYKAIMDSR